MSCIIILDLVILHINLSTFKILQYNPILYILLTNMRLINIPIKKVTMLYTYI